MRDFIKSQTEGSIAPMFALAAVILIGAGGAAVDYARLSSTRTALQAHADAAVLAMAGLGEDANSRELIKAGADSFAQNLGGDSIITGEPRVVPHKNSDGTVKVDVRYDMPTSLISILGIATLPANVTSVAAFPVQDYVDVNVLLDVSGSMNIADGDVEIDKFENQFLPYNNTRCAFACHSSDVTALYNGKSGYQIARENGVYLREDRVKDSILEMLDIFAADAASARIRVSVGSFAWGLQEFKDPTSNFEDVREYVKAIANNSGGTYIKGSIEQFTDRIPNGGNGTKARPRGVVVLVTDGVDYDGLNANTVGFDPQLCEPIKNDGHEVYVLNIKYPKIAKLTDHIDSRYTDVQAVEDSIATNLQVCSSNGNYYEAVAGSTITDAFKEIAASVTKSNVRLTE